MVLETTGILQKQGKLETAHRIIQTAGQVFRYAIQKGFANYNPTPDLNYQAGVSRKNAMIADWNAKDVARRGEQDLIEHQRKTAALAGNQRAALAGRGIDMSEGSALNILSDTEYLSKQDELTIKDNTAKKVWQAKMQAYNEGTNAELLQMRSDAENPLFSSTASLLTGAGQVASHWYRYANPRSATAF